MSHLHYILFRPPSGQVYKISKDWHFYLEVFMPPTYKEHIHNGKCYFCTYKPCPHSTKYDAV